MSNTKHASLRVGAPLPGATNLVRTSKGFGLFPLVDLSFKCSMPPSANRMWRHGKGNTYKDDAYDAWRTQTAWDIKKVSNGAQFSEPLSASLNFPRVHASRDLDNCIKPLLDAIQLSGAIKNDNLVHRIEAWWRAKTYDDQSLVWVTLRELT